jgi:sugar phosphate isomerase/epimerase
MEDWGRAARLLGDYLVALGVKDTTLVQNAAGRHTPEKGWQRAWAPLDDGVVNWHAVVRALRDIDFTGTGVFMPFYNEHDPVALQRTLTREVAYLRQVMHDVLAEEVQHAEL